MVAQAHTLAALRVPSLNLVDLVLVQSHIARAPNLSLAVPVPVLALTARALNQSLVDLVWAMATPRVPSLTASVMAWESPTKYLV
jgi:hypothetical protein